MCKYRSIIALSAFSAGAVIFSAGAVIAQPQSTAPKSVVIVVPERTQKAMVLIQPDKVMTPSEWKKMAAGLEEVKSLKVGMTRADVLQKCYPLNNEIFSENQRRYYLVDYPDLIVDLDFKTSFPISSDPHVFLNPKAYRLADYSGYFTDILTKIKVYYSGPATEKTHTVILR